MKRIVTLLIALLLVASLASCGTKPVAEPSAPESSVSESSAVEPAPEPEPAPAPESTGGIAVSFTDALGREVTVDHPKKVAVVSGSFAETWLLAGGDLFAVTEDVSSARDVVLPEDIVMLGAMKSPNMELIISEGVDFVVLSSKISEHVALRETLEAANINCAYFEVEDFADYLSMLKLFTDITGETAKYEENGVAVQKRIDDAIARKDDSAPTVLFIRAFSTGANAKGSDNMTGIMLKDMGCVNIADSETSLLEDLSMEKIIAADPEYIFVVTMGASSEKALAFVQESLISNPAWSGLSAVKNDKYIVLPKDLFHNKPNARWGESYEMLADILYGEK